jgi:hypothetical protein
MKYVLLFCKSDEDDRRFDALTDAERMALFGEVSAWQQRYATSFVEQGYRLDRSSAATTIRHRDGEVIVTDGPFVESGEVVGGYSVVEVPDLDAAMRIARAFPACPTVEIRPVLDD